MKKNYSIIRNAVLAAFALVSINSMADDKVVTFEDLTLDSESYWKGPDETGEQVTGTWGDSQWAGSFTSNGVKFSNNYSIDYGSWSGFSYSNSTSTVYESWMTDQWNSVTGSGYDGSKTFAVGYETGTITVSETGATVKGCYITNNTYAYTSLAKGGTYGEEPCAQGDYFKVTFTADNGNSVEFYLADYTSETEADHYIVDDWKWLDLSSLGTVKTISFSFDGTVKNDYGIVTPLYFCMDNLTIEETSTGIRSSKAGSAVEVARFSVDGKILAAPAKGLNIVKMSDGTVKKVYLK